MASYNFSSGTFLFIKELVADSDVGAKFLGKSICVTGKIKHYDHVHCRVTIAENGYELDVDTDLVGPCPFHAGWLFQFIGEVDKTKVKVGHLIANSQCVLSIFIYLVQGKLFLRARTATNKNGLDLTLYTRALTKRRSFMQEHNEKL